MSCTKCNESNDIQTVKYLIEVCDQLNEKYFQGYYEQTGWDAQQFGFLGFTYDYANYTNIIKFGDFILWDSENDEREYCKECEIGNHVESIGDYVERKYREYVNFLYKGLDYE